ncbi:MAG: glycosyltransferase family 4 protein [Gemmatimonadota bacterium]
MRILQQCMYFPPEVGGLESYVLDLTSGLVDEGHDVTMLTSRSMSATAAEETVRGVRVVRTWFPGKHPLGWAAHTAASIPTHARLAREADVLHAQTFASAPPSMLAHRRGHPFVLTLHTSHFQRRSGMRAWRPVLRRIIASADWLITASSQLLDMALGLYPHPRAEALTNAVNTSVFRPAAPALTPSPGCRLIVAPCRLFPPKGVTHLIAAMPRLRDSLNVELAIIGDGPDRDALERQVRALDLEDAIRFVGQRPRHEMPALLSSGEIVVMPSLMEATSIAALEAMACGRPVAASGVGGLLELIDDEVGTHFQPADPEDLAERVAALLNRPDLAEIGARARRRVEERWGIDRLVRRHLEIYRTLLDERG